MTNKRIIYYLSLIFILTNISCKKDLTVVGSGMIDNPVFVGKKSEDIHIFIGNKAIDSVFSVGLPVYSFGVYNNDAYGTLTANLSTTLKRDAEKFKSEGFGNNIKILEAKILIPFFSHKKNDNNTSEVVVDSVFGNQNFNVKIYELGYLLPSYDPNENLELTRKYYSNFDFTPFLLTKIADSTDYQPDFTPYITYERNKDGSFKLDEEGNKIKKDSLTPHFQIKVDTTYIRQKIFDKSGQTVLTSDQEFKDYFRGLYFKAEAVNNDGRFMIMNPDKAKLFISYTHDVVNDNDTPDDASDDFTEPKYEEINLEFNNPRVNTYLNTFSSEMQNAVDNSDFINGDENIYIKGDAGSMGIIHLFDEQELINIKRKKWKINKAEIYFYVNNDLSGTNNNFPDNLLLYNEAHNYMLADMRSKENMGEHNGIFDGSLNKKDYNNKYYHFDITKHIRNIIQHDSINVNLGLRIITEPTSLFDPFVGKSRFNIIDSYSPKGVVLYGNKSPEIEKRPKLVIYYTEIKE